MLGPKVGVHLEKLEKMLAASELGDTLTRAKVEDWNGEAHRLVQELIKSTTMVPPVVTTVDTPQPPPGVRQVMADVALDLSSKDEVFWTSWARNWRRNRQRRCWSM